MAPPRPRAPRPRRRRTTPAGDAQRFVAGMDIPGEWWTLFKSPKLDRLVEQALKGNPNVGAAQAALKQAHELYLAQKTSFFPECAGKLRCGPLRVSDGYADRTHERVELDLQPVYRAAELDLHARRVRRHPARGGDGQGAGAEHALPARSHLSDLDQQRGGHGHHRSVAPRADQEHPSGCSNCSISSPTPRRSSARSAPPATWTSSPSNRRRPRSRRLCRRSRNSWGRPAMR